MKGPTMRRLGEGSARRTEKPSPRSRVGATTTCSGNAADAAASGTAVTTAMAHGFDPLAIATAITLRQEGRRSIGRVRYSSSVAERIAIVDDTEGTRFALRRTLEAAGFSVVEGGTGESALKLARGLPDLMILDVHLPDLSGPRGRAPHQGRSADAPHPHPAPLGLLHRGVGSGGRAGERRGRLPDRARGSRAGARHHPCALALHRRRTRGRARAAHPRR